MNRIRTSVLAAVLAAGALSTPAAAQIPLVPRALGMGGAYVGVARGYESVFLNPANLGLSDGPAWSIAVPQALAGATLRGPEMGDLRDFIRYDDLSQQERDDLLATIPGGGTGVEADIRVPMVAVQTGGFALGVAYGLIGEHGVSRDVVELLLKGYDPARSDYTVQGTAGRRASYLDFAGAFGRSFGALSLGVTGHYYLGRSLSQTRAFDPDYLDALVTRDIRVEYVGVTSEGGKGYGVDVGAALEPVPGLTLSAAVANVVSSFQWNEELKGRKVVLSRDNLDADFEAVYKSYKYSGEDLGASPTGRFAEVAEGLFEDAVLPSTLRMGAAWTPPGGTTAVSAAYHTHLGEGTLAGRWERLAAVGIQQKLGFLTARGGLSGNLDSGRMVSGGVTLGPVDLAAARITDGEVDGTGRDGWVFSFGLSARGER